jgi:hypothetical protein
VNAAKSKSYSKNQVFSYAGLHVLKEKITPERFEPNICKLKGEGEIGQSCPPSPSFLSGFREGNKLFSSPYSGDNIRSSRVFQKSQLHHSLSS